MKRAVFGILIWVCTLSSVTAQDQGAIDAVAKAMDNIAARKWEHALQDAQPAGQVGQDIVEWYRLRSGNGTFSNYQEFLDRLSDWPGLPLMRRQGERSIPKNTSAKDVLAYFDDQQPATGVGALRLISAYQANGEDQKAEALAITAWTTLSLTKTEQAAFVAEFGDLLSAHHVDRLDMLLWRGKTSEAARMFGLVDKGHQTLAKARTGLMNKSNGVDAMIAAVPKELANDPGLANARFNWRASKGLTERALELLVSQSKSAQSLGRPEEWSKRRRSMARQLMRDGNSKLAYQVASQHFLEAGSDYADLEWLSGFIALSDLKDPQTALTHFQRFRVAVFTPISLGRAGYWEGRAHEALGQAEAARAAYEFAGEYQTSFYGQLAAEKAGLQMDPALTGQENYPDFKESQHWESSVMQAAMLFHYAGHPLLFTRFTRHLAETLNRQERGSVAQLALDLDQPYSALYIAKYAADNGEVLVRPYYPVTEIVDDDLPVPSELTLAIARRESEFYPGARSSVGARGLMQLMPRTGKAMAQKLGLSFSVDRLIDDPPYNATLGSAYLAELIETFGPAFPMVAAGYNAGPSRPRNWAKRYGDPRSDDVDAVDWVEHIPFNETRNYVMRVMESLPVYRARLTGKTAPLRLSQELKGR